MEEFWDLYDAEHKTLARRHRRGEHLPANVYHDVVFIWTISTDGFFLITKRSRTKPWGGYWENTGGSVVANETKEQGIVRELAEETGIRVTEADIILISADRGNSAFEYMYMTIIDRQRQTVTLQEGETCAYRWVAWAELEKMMADGLMAEPVARRFARYAAKIETTARMLWQEHDHE